MLYLYVNDDNIYDVATYPMAAYYPAVLLMTVLLSLILGVIWLIVMLRHTRSLRRNTALNQTVAAEIAAVPHSQADTIRKSAGPGLLLLSLSFFAQIAFNIDGVPVIPTVVAPALLLIGIRYFSRFMGLPRRCLRLPIAATAAGVLQYGAILLFTARHQEQAAIYFAKVKTPFLLPMIGEIVYGGLWIACLSLCLFPLLKRFLAEHTGAYWETAYREHNAAVLRDRQQRSFLLTLCLALSIVTTVGNAVSYALLYVLPWLRLITAGVALVTAILFRTLTVSARQAMEEKYAEPAP